MKNLQNAVNLNGLLHQVQTAAGQPSAQSSASWFGSFSMATLVIGIFAGLCGSAYFIYGKRQGDFTMLFTGMALWVVPLFITSAIGLSLTCAALVVAPFVIGRFL